MMGRTAIIAASILAGAFLFAGLGIQLGHAQSIILGPNGVQLSPPEFGVQVNPPGMQSDDDEAAPSEIGADDDYANSDDDYDNNDDDDD